MPPDDPGEFGRLAAAYRNTAEHNDALHQALTAQAWADPLLAAYRRHVEEHGLGFGDPAFHRLWQLLLDAAARRFGRIRALEIGVFKGQVVSLWSLLAREQQLDVSVAALTPLSGRPMPSSRVLNKLRHWFSPRFREQVASGNFYPADDYEAIIRAHFRRHGLDFDRVTVHRGFSTDPALKASLADSRFEIIYVDGITPTSAPARFPALRPQGRPRRLARGRRRGLRAAGHRFLERPRFRIPGGAGTAGPRLHQHPECRPQPGL